MGDHDYDDLRKLAEAATPGPWRYDGEAVASDHGVVTRGPRLTDKCAPGGINDACYIAAASPSTILSLLDALKAATERAERAERERDEALRTQAHVVAALREQESLCRDILKQRDEARAERDARPEITAEDAEHFVFAAEHFGMDDEDDDPIRVTWEALRAHAAKAKVTT